MTTIVKHDVKSPETGELYDVTYLGNVIKTLVTAKASMVTFWIKNLKIPHRSRLVVGLRTEWSNNTAATLNLCVGESCLIFQLLHADRIPNSLIAFLSDAKHTFVGVGIDKDECKLKQDCSLEVENCVDIGFLARARYGKEVRKSVGLKKLAALLLGIEFEKPTMIATGPWDKQSLSIAQVKYACVYAFVSYIVGLELDAAEYTKLYKKFLRGLRVNLDHRTTK